MAKNLDFFARLRLIALAEAYVYLEILRARLINFARRVLGLPT